MRKEISGLQEVDNLLMKIVTNENPQLNDYEWTIVTQALEYFKESLEINAEV